MIEVDRLMIDKYQITLLQMMEHAGENLAKLVRLKAKDIDQARILVFCGNGNNGGGGLVAARYLVNWGFTVKIITVGENSKRKATPKQHLQTLEQMNAKIFTIGSENLDQLLSETDVIIDAVIGYGLSGRLSTELDNLISTVNKSSDKLVIALDAPSGLDVSTGFQGNALHADATLTLALPKSGLIEQGSGKYVGQLYLADIGVPSQLYSEMGLQFTNPFLTSSVLKRTNQDVFEPVNL